MSRDKDAYPYHSLHELKMSLDKDAYPYHSLHECVVFFFFIMMNGRFGGKYIMEYHF